MALQWLTVPDDLNKALSPAKIVNLFDDNNDGAPDTDPLNDVATRAESMVSTALLTEYTADQLADSANKEALRAGALLYAILYAFQRAPEYVKQYGEGRSLQDYKKDADQYLAELKNGERLLVGTGGADEPATVGGTFVDPSPRLFYDNTTGEYTGGDF